jgi:hypothetical protein
MPLRGGGGSPPFYRPRRGRFTGVPHYFTTCGGMANNAVELTAVLANLAPVTASWRVLCLNRGGFEGRDVVVDRCVSRRARGSCWRRSLRGAIAGVATSRPRVLNSVGAVVAVRGVAQQGRGWPHRIDSGGYGAPVGLTSRFDPAESREEGSRVRLPPPPSRARRVSRTRVGGAVSRSWHRPRRTVPHSGGDGLPLGSWRNSAGAWFPGA